MRDERRTFRSRSLPARLGIVAFAGALAFGLAAAPASGAAPSGGDTPNPHGAVGEDLKPGSNSFTEAQVRERFGEMGFGEVKDLTKDAQGIWHGMATHAGKQLKVRMDYRGNVAAEE